MPLHFLNDVPQVLLQQMSPVGLVPQMLEIVILARFVEDFPHGSGIEVAAGSLVDSVR